MKTLRHLPSIALMLPVLFLFACGGEDDPTLTPEPSGLVLEQIMNGERAWRVASVTSDLPYDFGGTTTTDWFSQMEPCLNDDPLVLSYEARPEDISPDVLDIRVRTAQGELCSEFESPRDLIVNGESLERFSRYELAPITVIQDNLYGYTDFSGPLEEVWEEMFFSADSITYQTDKLRDQVTYRVRVKLVPM